MRETAPPEVTVSGTASGPVDLRCATKVGSTWSFGTLLTGGDNVPVTGSTFTAGPVVLPTDDAALCRLVAVPHGTTPTDLTGISGPSLRLLIVRNTGAQTDSHGGANDGRPFNHFTTAGGTVADTGYTAVGNTGIDSMSLLSSDPGELGRVFDDADRIPELDPTGRAASASTARSRGSSSTASTPSPDRRGRERSRRRSVSFRDYQPFPSVGVTINPVLGAGDQFVEVENDVVVSCRGSDPMWYLPQSATCTGLVDSGVRLTVSTFVSAAGNAVTRSWRLASTDGRTHDVKLWIAHAAATNGVLSRAWKLPGDAGYTARNGGDGPAASGPAPWIARFDSAGAADGDASQGVGAVAASAVPSALHFASGARARREVPARGAGDRRRGTALRLRRQCDAGGAGERPCGGPCKRQRRRRGRQRRERERQTSARRGSGQSEAHAHHQGAARPHWQAVARLLARVPGQRGARRAAPRSRSRNRHRESRPDTARRTSPRPDAGREERSRARSVRRA